MAVDTITRDETDTANANPTTEDGFQLQRPFKVPDDSQFEGGEFLEAPEIAKIAKDLIFEFPGDFPRHDMAKIDYLWRMKGGMKDGGAQLGMCQRTPAIAIYYSETEFTIWVAADNCRLAQITPGEMRALVFDLLYHIEYNSEKDKFKIRAPDVSTFMRTVEVMGPWNRTLRRAQKAFAQAPLPLYSAPDPEPDEATPEDAEHTEDAEDEAAGEGAE
jgi:Putative phage metallopeptidase